MPVVTGRRRSRTRAFIWGALGLWALCLALFFVFRTPIAQARVGEQLVSPELSVRRPDGTPLPLISPDSPTVVLAATSECAACREGVSVYREISDRLHAQGVAFRVVVGSDSLATRQFSRLLADPSGVAWDPGQKLFRKLGVKFVPTLYLLSKDGQLVKAWSPFLAHAGAADTVSAAVKQIATQVQ